jgi:hypothetical protein
MRIDEKIDKYLKSILMDVVGLKIESAKHRKNDILINFNNDTSIIIYCYYPLHKPSFEKGSLKDFISNSIKRIELSGNEYTLNITMNDNKKIKITDDPNGEGLGIDWV